MATILNIHPTTLTYR